MQDLGVVINGPPREVGNIWVIAFHLNVIQRFFFFPVDIEESLTGQIFKLGMKYINILREGQVISLDLNMRSSTL